MHEKRRGRGGLLKHKVIYDHYRLANVKGVSEKMRPRWNANDKSRQTVIKKLLIELWHLLLSR